MLVQKNKKTNKTNKIRRKNYIYRTCFNETCILHKHYKCNLTMKSNYYKNTKHCRPNPNFFGLQQIHILLKKSSFVLRYKYTPKKNISLVVEEISE